MLCECTSLASITVGWDVVGRRLRGYHMNKHTKVVSLRSPAASDERSTADSPFQSLMEKIATREAVVSIIGLGYVGLPLALAIADAGFRVVGIDIDSAKVDDINDGNFPGSSPQAEPPDLSRFEGPALGTDGASAPRNRSRKGSLSATVDYSVLSAADAVVVCVPTPLSRTRDPDLSYVLAAIDEIASRLRRGTLVVMESTVYPGMTEEIVLPRLRAASGNADEIGADFFLAFSPERVDPGRAEWTLRNTPKVLAGITTHCAELGRALYESVVQKVVTVSSPKVAEMAKLLENTYRATNIALVNEMAIMCDRLGIDVWDVIDAAKTKPFGFAAFYPGPGVGGHCIPVDPLYLAWKLRSLGYNPRFIQLADEINLAMPGYVLRKISDALNKERKQLKGSRLLILGVAYKADVSDVRESPVLSLIHQLREKGAEVDYNDPYIARLDVNGMSMASVALSAQSLCQADCVIIAVAHTSYDWEWVVANSRLVVDTRNATGGGASHPGRVVKL